MSSNTEQNQSGARKALLKAVAAVLRENAELPETPETHALDMLADMQEHDVVISFDVTVATITAKPARVKGSFTMDQVLSAGSLPEARRIFDNTFYQLLWRPVENRFNTLVNRAAEEHCISVEKSPGVLSRVPKASETV